jgi:hypothetical protein
MQPSAGLPTAVPIPGVSWGTLPLCSVWLACSAAARLSSCAPATTFCSCGCIKCAANHSNAAVCTNKRQHPTACKPRAHLLHLLGQVLLGIQQVLLIATVGVSFVRNLSGVRVCRCSAHGLEVFRKLHSTSLADQCLNVSEEER